MWCLAEDWRKSELKHFYFDRLSGKLLFRLVGMRPINFCKNFLNSAFKIIDRLFWLWINKLCFSKRLKTFRMTKWNILQVSKDGKWLLSQIPIHARAHILDWGHSFVTCWQWFFFCCCFAVVVVFVFWRKKEERKKKKKTSQAENNSKTLRSCKPALKKSFPGDIKLQLQPRKPAHQATSEVENPNLGDNRPTCCSFLSRHQKTPGNICSHQQVLKGQPQGGSISLPSHFVKTISTCSSCLLRPSQKQVVERLDQYLLEKQGRSPHFWKPRA